MFSKLQELGAMVAIDTALVSEVLDGLDVSATGLDPDAPAMCLAAGRGAECIRALVALAASLAARTAPPAIDPALIRTALAHMTWAGSIRVHSNAARANPYDSRYDADALALEDMAKQHDASARYALKFAMKAVA